MRKTLWQKVNSSVTTTTIIIALFGIAVTAVACLDVVQSASATTDMMTRTLGDQESLNTTSISSNNSNNSDSVLGKLFLTGEDRLTSFNPVNQTYTEVSYVGNRTIMPPPDPANTTITAATINATEIGNLTLKLQPNGITFVEGRSFLVTEVGEDNNNDNNSDGRDSEQQQENATAVLIDLNGVRPDDPRSSTGVAFFSTNSTGQLAFLDNMIAIYQVKASPAGTAIQMWEWKGADLPFDNIITSTIALGFESEQAKSMEQSRIIYASKSQVKFCSRVPVTFQKASSN
jgi:hypothetical protein